jgi:Chloroplast envelope transporter
MNGLEIIDLNKGSFMQRLLKKEPKENAYVEINNLIAATPTTNIDKQHISSILERYKLSNEKAKSRLIGIYTQILKHFLKDFRISDGEHEELQRLQEVLWLDKNEASWINSAVINPIFQKFVRDTYLNGVVTEQEKSWLERVCEQLRIDEETKMELFTVEAHRAYKNKFDAALSDGQLSPTEEIELAEIASNLNADISYTADTEILLSRMRRLWQLSNGNLPVLNIPIYLQKNEQCSAYVSSSHYELRKITKAIVYSGYSVSNTVFGVRFRSGVIKSQRITNDVLQFLDDGTLYFTNKRLLFNGSHKTTQIPLSKIIGATFYADGLIIEKSSGKDQVFKFNGDFEELQIIFDSLMTMNNK